MKALLASHPSPYLRDFRVVNDIKERLGSVALDYGSVGDSADNEKYELPDGQVSTGRRGHVEGARDEEEDTTLSFPYSLLYYRIIRWSRLETRGSNLQKPSFSPP